MTLGNSEEGALDLQGFGELSGQDLAQVAEDSLGLARELWDEANAKMKRKDRKAQAKRVEMIGDEEGRLTLTDLVDRAFRSNDPKEVMATFQQILQEMGIPEFFSKWEKFLLSILKDHGHNLPAGFTVGKIKKKMRGETRDVLLPAERKALKAYLKTRAKEGVRANVVNLGEAIIGEGQAEAMMEDDIDKLKDPDIDCISVKASNAYSQVSALAYDHSVEMMCERLRPRLDAAKEYKRQDFDEDAADPEHWDKGYKLVNLDMEEYRDLAITVDALKQLAMEPEYMDMQIGVALQSYIPDSYGVLEDLIEFSRRRVAQGGAPLRVRIVKGANKDVEAIEASAKHHEDPTYQVKMHTDANWLCMVELATRKDNLAVCHVGFASHNGMSLSFAKALLNFRSEEYDGLDYEAVSYYEVLEGMMNPIVEVGRKILGQFMVYAPTVADEKFLLAIAYLVRRFAELSDKNNFLANALGEETGSAKWEEQEEAFMNAIAYMAKVSHARRRQQNRFDDDLPEDDEEEILVTGWENLLEFVNEADTDWTVPVNQKWLKERILSVLQEEKPEVKDVALYEQSDDRYKVMDRSQTDKEVATVELLKKEMIGAQVDRAAGCEGWSAESNRAERNKCLAKAVTILKAKRAEMIVAMAQETGKAVGQGDPEASEAVDFGNFYPLAAEYFRQEFPNVNFKPKDVVGVYTPWNFPGAIPAGGIFAALAAGCRVVLKPSPKSYMTTTLIAECLWKAGVPRDALVVVNCEDADAGEITKHQKLDMVVFTGGTETVDEKIIKERPDLKVCAETGGKNLHYMPKDCDREAAIKDVVKAAFGHLGQKCSATSILAVDREIYESDEFWELLEDAADSLEVGPASDPKSVITPMIGPRSDKLKQAHEQLGHDEEWVLPPRNVDGRDDHWRPAIKKCPSGKGFTVETELFGPVLTVVPIDTGVDQVIEMQKETGYGLTAGIHTLDDKLAAEFCDKSVAGVTYRNDGTTGAIVGQIPFGGNLASRRGAGRHAGGVNYVTNFWEMTEPDGKAGDPEFTALTDEQIDEADCLNERAKSLHSAISLWEKYYPDVPQYADFAEDIRKIIVAGRNYLYEQVNHFSQRQNPHMHIRGRDLQHSYRSDLKTLVRINLNDSLFEMLGMVMAAIVSGNKLHVSMDALPDDPDPQTKQKYDLAKKLLESFDVAPVEQDQPTFDVYLMQRMQGNYGVDQVRCVGRDGVSATTWDERKHNPQLNIVTDPVLRTGRLELLNNHSEKTVVDNYHRLGQKLRPETNLADRNGIRKAA